MKKVKITALCLLLSGMVLLLCALDFPSWQKLEIRKIVNASAASIIYDKDGNELGAVGQSRSARYLKKEEIPDYVKHAFIACEDKRFYSHPGIDIRRVFGALINNLRAASYEEGGSTITQQLVKLTHLTQEKKLSRKANEAVLAIRLERELSKDEILTAYLNTVYFGSGAYGIENASYVYFGKSAEELTVPEAAALAGIIKAPTAYSPRNNPDKTEERRNYVLERMQEDGYISMEDMEKWKTQKI
ncbi:MAG: transglycosylase domain-containing protein, partial [Clostridia bacterium]|nr:transglycosylase domain-containing protein [Clostridia bacterium]